MILLDTSVWIEFFKAKTPYLQIVESLLENREVIAVECVFGELLQGTRSKKEQDVIFEYWKNLPKADESQIWIKAGNLSAKDKLISKGIGLIDLAIYCAAENSKAKIWTLDKKLEAILPASMKYNPL